ncbi:MAG: hypothetical protein K2Q22_03170 [Cytophagales bacterium]|nr:hypothetical protein [Cytophagales bacterium]
MEGPQVLVSKTVLDKLDHLETILYEEGYFGFEESSIKYVRKIRDTFQNIPFIKAAKTKNPIVGTSYVRHKVNRNTTYYITFDAFENRFLIKNIFSNHEKGYSEYIK